MSLRAKLKRMEVHMKQEETPIVERNEANRSASKSWASLETVAHTFDEQVCYIREVRHSLDAQYGFKTFRAYRDGLYQWDCQSFSHPLSRRSVPINKLIFFDTETTGLSAGAGTQMFLLGFACFEEEEIVVRQYLLPSPDAESALYHYFLKDVGQLEHLVSFNGKAFDWPRLKTRHAYLRDTVPHLPQFGHFDLLHSARRMWKNELPSCKLSVIEEEKLGIERNADTPSHLVPLLYFDFVREQDPALIASVFEHHEQDVLSLIALYAQLTEKVINWEEQTSLNERLQLAKWHQRNGELEVATTMLTSGINAPQEQSSQKGEAYFYRGYAYKKKQLYEQAVADFKKVLKDETLRFKSANELALIYEHYLKDFTKAFTYANQALSFATIEKERLQALKRINRLKQK